MNIEIDGHEYLTFVPGVWKQTRQVPIEWFEENFSQFVYSYEHIIKEAVPYELTAIHFIFRRQFNSILYSLAFG